MSFIYHFGIIETILIEYFKYILILFLHLKYFLLYSIKKKKNP